jgi:hypothetical protein
MRPSLPSLPVALSKETEALASANEASEDSCLQKACKRAKTISKWKAELERIKAQVVAIEQAIRAEELLS